MYVKSNELKATGENVVLEIVKWPNPFMGSTLIAPSGVNNYDNGKELYIGRVIDSALKGVATGSYAAIDIYYGSHIPTENPIEKVKIVPYSGIVLKSESMLNVMSDITKMTPGKDRVFIRLIKKESKTKGGIIIPDSIISQDPTAQDVRFAEVLKSNYKGVLPGDIVVIESFAGKEVYLDSEKDLYIVCYGIDILAKVE